MNLGMNTWMFAGKFFIYIARLACFVHDGNLTNKELEFPHCYYKVRISVKPLKTYALSLVLILSAVS